MAKESMEKFAKRRGRDREAKMKAKEASSAPVKGRKGKDSPDAVDGGTYGWTKGNRKPKAGC